MRIKNKGICVGFTVTIVCHTKNAVDELDPSRIRYALGKALDASNLVEEEIDYTLVVVRNYDLSKQAAVISADNLCDADD